MSTNLRNIIVIIALGVMLALGIDSRLSAQERRGTAGAAHLLVTPTARLSSLGSSGTAGGAEVSGVEMVFVNPAGLAANQGTGALFSRMDYLVEVAVNTVSLGQQLGNNQIGLFINSWDFGDIPRQTEENPEISDLTFSPGITTVGASYARVFTDRIAAGITVKLVSEDIDDIGATAVAFDGGLTYEILPAGFRFGFSVRNIGSKLSYSGPGLSRQFEPQRQGSSPDTYYIESESVELPTLLNAGITYTRSVGSDLSVSLLANFRSNSFDQDQYAGGIEIGYLNLVYARGGFELREAQDLTAFGPGSFGAGLNFDLSGLGLSFDYAYRPTDFFSDVQLFTLVVAI